MSVDDTPNNPAVFWPDRVRRLLIRLAEKIDHCPHCRKPVAYVRMPRTDEINAFDFTGSDHLFTCSNVMATHTRRNKDSIV